VDQQRVSHASPKYVARKLVVELSPIPNMVQVGLPVQRDVEASICLHTCEEALVVIPVRTVNRDRSIAVAVQSKKGSEAVAEFRSPALFESRKTEPSPETRVPAKDLIGTQNALLEFRWSNVAGQRLMIVRVVSDQMAAGALVCQNSGAVLIVYVLADCKQKGVCPPQVLQESCFGFGPMILRDDLP
jgi:hypothetical protein